MEMYNIINVIEVGVINRKQPGKGEQNFKV